MFQIHLENNMEPRNRKIKITKKVKKEDAPKPEKPVRLISEKKEAKNIAPDRFKNVSQIVSEIIGSK